MPSPNKVLRPWEKKRPPTERPYIETFSSNQGRKNSHREIYGSQRWREQSKRFLLKHPLCVHCQAMGKLTESTQTDHIVPINNGGDPWDEANYQAICKRCHDKKSARERHQSKTLNQ